MEFAVGPDLEEVEVLDLPNSLERYMDLQKQGVNAEEAEEQALIEFARVKELNDKVLKPVKSPLRVVNQNIKRNTIITWGAAIGHPVTWSLLGWRMRSEGDKVAKVVASGAEAMMLASCVGKPE